MPSWLPLLLRFSVSGGIIFFLVSRIDLADVLARLNDANPWWLAAVFFLFLLQSGLTAWRWRRVNRRLNIDFPLAWHIRHFLISLFFGQALPTTVGGDVVRTWHLTRACGSAATAISSVIVDRAIGLVTLLLLTVISLPLFISRSIDPDMLWGILLIVGGVVLVCGLLVVFGGLPKRLERFSPARFLAGPINEFRSLLLDLRESCLQCCIGLAVHLISILAFVILAWAFHISLPIVVAIAVLPAVLLVAGIPVSIAGWGVREGSMVAGFALLGLSGTDALILSLAFGLGELSIGLVGGAFWLVGGKHGAFGALATLRSSPAASDPPP